MRWKLKTSLVYPVLLGERSIAKDLSIQEFSSKRRGTYSNKRPDTVTTVIPLTVSQESRRDEKSNGYLDFEATELY